MFKRILVAVDGSDTADQALQEAINLTKEMKAQLRIVYVVDTLNINVDTEFPSLPEFSDAIVKNGQAVLRKPQRVEPSVYGQCRGRGRSRGYQTRAADTRKIII